MPVEVKILSRAIAYRLSAVAPTLIHPSQAGFVQGRRMSDHIHLIQALQHRASRDDAEHYTAFLGFEKAYDRVDHEFVRIQSRRYCGQILFRLWAALNLDKCVTLVLNNNETPLLRRSTPSLILAQSGTPIRYLGAFVGHNLDPEYHVQLVTDKLLTALPQWKYRARTLAGRRIIASTMVLSQIWHITAATPIPTPRVLLW
ncbi:hypothetical protein DYB32_009814 [Aphanomyces invadans]|uniref:Uncharacterized protein n=1 Tax=Aphanomyces invadans TaxID=157072 RepID=A0A3R6Y106_9STRA|nr:hypothetical protein DYB32_009814 [Aphanomyces invadans]